MDNDIKLRERNRGTTATRENQEVSSFDLTFSDLSYTVGKGKKMFNGHEAITVHHAKCRCKLVSLVV